MGSLPGLGMTAITCCKRPSVGEGIKQTLEARGQNGAKKLVKSQSEAIKARRLPKLKPAYGDNNFVRVDVLLEPEGILWGECGDVRAR